MLARLGRVHATTEAVAYRSDPICGAVVERVRVKLIAVCVLATAGAVAWQHVKSQTFGWLEC
jgi:hypothetical protein